MTESPTGEPEWAAPAAWAKKTAERRECDAAVIIVFRRPVGADRECMYRVTGHALRAVDHNALESWMASLRNEMDVDKGLETPALEALKGGES